MIHPRAEEIQTPKLDMGAQSEADAVIGHPRPSEADHDVQKSPYLAHQLLVSRTAL
jgi:hypothetical protein